MYVEALNPVLDRAIEERGRPPKAAVAEAERDRIRGRGEGALAATYTEIIIRRDQRRNGVTNANYETSIHEHQKFVAGVRGAIGGFFSKRPRPRRLPVRVGIPKFANAPACANTLVDIKKEIQESMFNEAFQNRYGMLAEHIERLKSRNGMFGQKITAESPLHIHEELAALQARYEPSRMATSYT